MRKINIEQYNIPLWSAPFGLILLDNINYSAKIKTVLDIGFGNGFPILELSERLDSKTKLFGIDINELSVNELNKKLELSETKNISLSMQDAENLSFNDNYFDLIVSNNGVNNVNNPVKAIKECSRVCKLDGEFVFTFNLFDTYARFYEVFKKTLLEHKLFKEIKELENYRNKKRPCVNMIKTLLSNVGFSIDKEVKSQFEMCFSNGSTFFNHYFIKKYFLPDWKKIVPDTKKEIVFECVKNELNQQSEQKHLKFSVPFVCLKCKKVTNDNK